MLSIIISSYQEYYFSSLYKNIEETIGNIPYEIIKINNPGLMGLCQAYNQGAKKAHYNYLLFIHEDILFVTINWGEILVNLLKNKEIGVIGIAGSSYVSNSPSFWWSLKETRFSNLIQSFRENKKIITYKLEPKYGNSKNVYSLDGVLLACRKEVYLDFPFNEKLKGYHGYDLDFSVRVASQYKNIVTSEILIHHFSGGNSSQSWFRDLIKARDNFTIPQDQINNKNYELRNYYIFVHHLYDFKFPFFWSINKQLKYLSFNKLGFKGFLLASLKIIRYIIKYISN